MSYFLVQNSRSFMPAHPKTVPKCLFGCTQFIEGCSRTGAQGWEPGVWVLWVQVCPSVCKCGFTALWALYNTGIAPWCMSPRDNVTTQPAWSCPFLPCLRLSLHLQGYGRGWVRLRGRTVVFSFQKHSLDASMCGIPLRKLKSGVLPKSLVKSLLWTAVHKHVGEENDLHLGKKGVCPSGFSAPMEELWLKTRSLSSHLALFFKYLG